MSQCNNDAFQLAQTHNQMEVYADIIGKINAIMPISFFLSCLAKLIVEGGFKRENLLLFKYKTAVKLLETLVI